MHGDVPNAYVKEDKEEEFDIYIRVPHGMQVDEDMASNNNLALEQNINRCTG